MVWVRFVWSLAIRSWRLSGGAGVVKAVRVVTAVGMVRVFGRDHRAFARAGHQCPVLIRLEAVVVAAEAVEIREAGAVGVGPGSVGVLT